MKLSEFDRHRAYKKAFKLLDKMNQLIDSARKAHEKSVAEVQAPKKAA